MVEQAMPHILVVDDDREICGLVTEFLQQHHYRVFQAYDGEQMLEIFEREKIDLIILDVMMPKVDGITLCREIRNNSSVPIIMLTAMHEDIDQVVGLEVGADAYITKPFNFRVLLAHIKSILRRETSAVESGKHAEDDHDKTKYFIYEFNDLVLDTATRSFQTKDGEEIVLSNGEYELLLALVKSSPRALSRDDLLELTRGRSAEPYDRSIDVLISRLRQKIESNPKQPKLIMTIRSHGYRFNGDAKKRKLTDDAS